MKACHHCHVTIESTLIIGTTTLCPSCGKPLHSCFNCRFYSPGSYHDCLEGIEEYIEEKTEPNYCDAFMLGEYSKEEQKKKTDAKARAEAFFNF
ncbi:hypothetical protein SpiGrapes_2518 [Sphaerochaeta pleomorpha str. Grapes]|uniref:Uncharacterized protein n=1 Tax=Sphaerochaeta pleomorpha (strain ATCC BAA-1885 / DSM 22778 / Grapes) TaxID=158190 RepID=G8QU32_SPHPG|nr:hypothetical protein [Sphaerochaeta pleomorpha]AEV30279.1 hypothetical protein SpiGrapes_2518 [Sphaerochaeta pleomorpha str. Grapes]